MADPQSEAEKIRNKRLAKLSSSASVPSPASSSGTETPSSNAPTLPTQPTTLSPKPPVNQSQPLTPQPASQPKPSSRIATPRSTTPAGGQPSSRPRPGQSAESSEEWIDRTLSSIFRITLRADQKADAFGNRLIFTGGLRAELEDSGSPLQLSTEVLDGAIIEAASNLPDKKPLLYLLGCWKRVMKSWRTVRGGEATDPRLAVIKEARRLCMSYCVFAITMPDMFGLEPTEQSPLVEYLLRDPESDSGVCQDFLAEAVSRFPEDDSIKEALIAAVEQLGTALSGMSMNDGFKPYVGALRTLTRYIPIVQAITESTRFLPSDVEAQNIESQTLLGPWFALSPLHTSVAENYFRGAQAQGESYIANNQNDVRLTLRTHQDDLFEISNCIIKAGKEPRERMLDWFALVMNKNHKRRGTYVDHQVVSSDGFMINITTILDRLCEPFMDATFSKLDRIDVNYLRRSPRVAIDDETKVNADQKVSDDFYSHTADGANNFISEIFFLTLAAHHYGTEATGQQVEQIKREIKSYERDLERFEAERSKYLTDPARLPVFDAQLKRFKDMLEGYRSRLKAVQGVLLDELSQQRSMQLMRYVIAWLLRIVQPETEYPKKQLKLPLAVEQPLVFQTLPEYFLEDIIDNFKFVTSQMPFIIPQTQCEELVTVCITFLRSSEYIKNPYLKAGLVSILFYGVWPFRGKAKGVLGELLNSSTFCHKHLLHALMKFYIEAEQTGAHTQFYDKFNIRYEIFQVIRCVWSNPIYRENLNLESKVNHEFFVRFVNLLLNDVTYVLGESFTAFNKIHDLQNELEATHSELTEEERQAKQAQLEQTQKTAKNSMQLTNETISMLKLFTEVLAEPFTMPEIVQRLADMLDYNLEAMVGPKQKNLKVREPDQYHFKPSILLSDLMDVYMNLKDMTSFHIAVARDGRSYKPFNFDHAAEIMLKTKMKSPEELRTWKKLSQIIAQAKEREDQAEEDLGEIPDEFLDPIMASLMEEPVILPQSRMTVDKSTIRSHLLSDPVDPFNRAPLKIEDVIPDVEMKAKIDKFKEDARQRKLNAAHGNTAGAGDKMDLS